ISLLPDDVIYFSIGGDLIMTCAVDQDVHLNSVVFERDGISQIVIFPSESLDCNPQKFQNDRYNYNANCYQQRNFTLTKHGVNAEDHNKSWHCSMVSNSGGPCISSTPCISNKTIAILH
ncbi:hypothetical protein CHS0354_030024, partial [Potamilus streckersoni]